MPSHDMAVLEGALSVQAVLDCRTRDIVRIDVARNAQDPRIGRVVETARRHGVRVHVADRAALDLRATGRTHGGVLALVGPRRFTPLDQLGRGATTPFVALLDGVEDPYNLGQAVRSLYAAGAHGLLLRRPRRAGADMVIARASAGASERMPTTLVEGAGELEAAVRELRDRGLRVVCAHRSDADVVYEADLSGPLVLAMGGERRGLTRRLALSADVRVTVPYGRWFRPALDITSATAVVAFEIARQRRAAAPARGGSAGASPDGEAIRT
ncbi:TrmH family RNA methyltransferase [Actinopolymorpha pittospori]|uniref:23S rRNA (Guanosine2251-2'-O)-methyltransferase n=1 Tax=Actinopolymorpha pittospori TaxID=648752 RepID=A0A927MVJ0_9ACTN|nr:RNA methyltransferase [Actinopolymorpha pittospori]MBE1607019.1 23S rRNA (guanosine2251-2'-O)-methyltransferase [Actinopolymorpha pittospori]